MGKTIRDRKGDSGFRGTMAPGGRVTRGGVILLFLLGLLFTLAGAVPLVLALPLLLDSEETRATVAAVDQLPNPSSYRVWFEFTTASGQPIRASTVLVDRRRTPRLAPGQQVNLFYSRTNPQNVELNDRRTFWVGGWLWLIPGLFLLWLGRQAQNTR